MRDKDKQLIWEAYTDYYDPHRDVSPEEIQNDNAWASADVKTKLASTILHNTIWNEDQAREILTDDFIEDIINFYKENRDEFDMHKGLGQKIKDAGGFDGVEAPLHRAGRVGELLKKILDDTE